MKTNAFTEGSIVQISSPCELLSYIKNSVSDQIFSNKTVHGDASGSFYHGYLFFDLDETLVYKDTSLSEEFSCSQKLVQQLCESCLSCCPMLSLADSTERHRYSNDRVILQAMLERIYYAAKLHCISDVSEHDETIAQCLAELRDSFTSDIVRAVGITTNRILPYCIRHRANILPPEGPESASDSDVEENECAQCSNSSIPETSLPALWQSLYEIDHLQHQIHHIHQIINVLRTSMPNFFGQYLTNTAHSSTANHNTNEDADFSGTMILPRTKAVVSSVAGVGEIIFRGLSNWTNYSSIINNTHNPQPHKIRRNKGAILWDYLSTVHGTTCSSGESTLVCDVWLIDDTYHKLQSALTYLMLHASAVMAKDTSTQSITLVMSNGMTLRLHMLWFRAVELRKGSDYREVVSEVLRYVRFLQCKYTIIEDTEGVSSHPSDSLDDGKNEGDVSSVGGNEKDQWIADYWKQSPSSFQCILRVLEDELR